LRRRLVPNSAGCVGDTACGTADRQTDTRPYSNNSFILLNSLNLTTNRKQITKFFVAVTTV